jgi:hypothetical protein
MKRHGDPRAGGPPLIRYVALRHYREMVLTFTGDTCLIWPFARSPKGYGIININSKTRYVSHYACHDTHGPAPTPNHEAAHSCGNGHLGCVNPRHIVWKTPKENMADRFLHGTDNRGERAGTSKVTESNVREIRALKGRLTQRRLAHQFGVSLATIRDIQRRKSWAWLD